MLMALDLLGKSCSFLTYRLLQYCPLSFHHIQDQLTIVFLNHIFFLFCLKIYVRLCYLELERSYYFLQFVDFLLEIYHILSDVLS